MAKIKVGNVVRLKEARPDLDLTKGEVGIVASADKGDAHINVNFISFNQVFEYNVSLTRDEFEKVGKRIERKRLSELRIGDLVILDHESNCDSYGNEVLNVEVHEIEEIERDYEEDQLVFTGEDFIAIAKAKAIKKDRTVPVVV